MFLKVERVPNMILFYLLKRKRFLISALFLITLVTWSILNTVLNHGHIRQLRFRTDDKGNFIDAAPYPPFSAFLFGSDRYGYDIGMMLVEGAKWTVGVTLVVVILRMLISLLLSSLVYSLKPRFYEGIKSIFEPFSIVPQTIICYFILFSVLWEPSTGFSNPFWQRALFQTFIMAIVAIPNLTIHLTSEMRSVEKESFIEAAKTLGASKSSIFFKHIIPHVYEKWIILFGQQFFQSFQLLAHLGFMKLFFGGTDVAYGDDTPPRSLSFEWSGLIGDGISYLYVQQWIVLVPMAFFIATAVSVALINDSIKDYFKNGKVIYLKRREKKVKINNSKSLGSMKVS
jgi:peptide/nickel transport system permease protein